MAYKGWSRAEIYFKDLRIGGDFRLLNPNTDDIFMVRAMNDAFYVMTNYEAPKYRIFKGHYDKPELEFWEEVVPEGESVMETFGVVGGNIIVAGLRNASSNLRIYSPGKEEPGTIALPAIGSVMADPERGFGTEPEGEEFLFGFSSFTVPPRIYRYDMKGGMLSVLDSIETDLDFSQFQIEQVWFPSKDSTPVSMFLVHKKGLNRDGNNPAVVYGYGGFNAVMTPYFSRTLTHFLDRGGVYAYTQIRGGGEYGEEWHRGGMLENKQNSFDDFIAACEWLIENNYTNPNRLAIEGGSNGGLLVGAVMVQRPDLMKAVVCSRPLLDMLRYHKFLIGELWVPEYGSADNPEQFEYLYAYSPYHHVVPNTAYPAVLFASADHDSRVDPLHARKMTAAVQAATSSDNPILYRFQRKTGHGQGAPRSIVIEEVIDEWSFVFRQLGM